MSTVFLLNIMVGLRVVGALAQAGAKTAEGSVTSAIVRRFVLVAAFDACFVALTFTTGYGQFALMVALGWGIAVVAGLAKTAGKR